MAVPFMFTVAPRGSTNEATLRETPRSSSLMRRLMGSAALLDEVEKANTITS
jgi:hypothetical protein